MTEEPTFAPVDLSGECPEAVCHACAQHGVEHVPSGVQFVHCEHHSAGAWLSPRGWATATGVGAAVLS